MGKRTMSRTTNSRQFLKILKANGWEQDRKCKSSHSIYKKGNNKVVIKESKLNAMIQRRLIKELGLMV